MLTSEVLNKAADLIEERGWAKGPAAWAFGYSPGAPVCLEGGIQAALGIDFEGFDPYAFQGCPSYKAVETYLEAAPGEVWDWNDQPERTATEVIEVLRACAVIEASREREAAEVTA